MSEGKVRRHAGADGKIVNAFVNDESRAEKHEQRAAPSSPEPTIHLASEHVESRPPGDSQEQRDAERMMLDLLGNQLGVRFEPVRVSVQTGARIVLDRANADKSIIVECWVHQGSPKAAEKHKGLADALKPTWIATTIYSRPRLVLV